MASFKLIAGSIIMFHNIVSFKHFEMSFHILSEQNWRNGQGEREKCYTLNGVVNPLE